MNRIRNWGLVVLGLATVLGTTMLGTSVASAATTAFPAGTCLYFAASENSSASHPMISAVVATSGNGNCRKNVTLTIDGFSWAPYEQETGNPDSVASAFSSYLSSLTGEYTYGPGNSFIPAGYPKLTAPSSTTGYKLLWSGRNANTNNSKTYVYVNTVGKTSYGPADDGTAQTLANAFSG